MQLTDLSQWLDTQKPHIDAALKHLVNTNTHSLNLDGVEAGMVFLEALAVEMGFRVQTVNQRHRLIMSGNGKGKRILLITHMDTVHAPESSFKTYQDLGDGFVTGPGAGDIHGGTVIGLWAMKALSELMQDYDLHMIVSADEERGSPTLKDWYSDPAQHGAAYGIGLEPGFPQGTLTPTVDLGVVYQRRGYAALTFSVVGKSAHSGTPELGLSAIEALAHKILKLQALNDAARNVSVNVGLVHGGSAPNTVPETVEATVSFRYSTLADGIATREAIEKIVLEPSIRNEALNLVDSAVYHLDTFIAPMERTAESQKLIDIVLQEAQSLGLPVVPIARGGGSDANHVSGGGIPCICGMGAPAEGIHTEQEKIYLPMLHERVILLARTLYQAFNQLV